MHRRYLIILTILLVPLAAFTQGRLVLNGGYVVLSSGTSATPAYVELNNPASTAITNLTPGTGWIISESEFNMVKWDIGTSTGTYSVPFGYSNLDYLPLTFKVVTAGVGSGSVLFSTWHTIADNWTGTISVSGRPSDVTQMNPSNAALSAPTTTDDSYWVVDRFWVIDANTGYTTKPSPNITFTYIDNGTGTEIASPNIFTESQLLAQRFNSTSKTWGDYLGTTGTDIATPPTGACKNDASAAISPANFFRSWTLSSQNDPLPINLASFNVECNNDQVVIKWSTATEVNNDYFTIERSVDGNTYETVAVVKGAGNSTTTQNYSVIDYTPMEGTSYYRLSQTDFDGKTAHYAPVAFNGCHIDGTIINAFSSNGNIVVRITSSTGDNYSVTLMNTIGQVITNITKSLSAGYNEFTLSPENLSRSVYLLNIRSEKVNYNRKLILGNL